MLTWYFLISDILKDISSLIHYNSQVTLNFQVISVMSMWTRVQPAYAANMWNEALNKRLGTEVHIYTLQKPVSTGLGNTG